MKITNFKSTNETEKYANAMQKQHKYCKNCGHTVTIIYGIDKVECGYCHKYVFKDDKTEFKFRVKEEMNRKK